ncbi:MAG TPA: excinuclease ABC subunit UvrC [Bacillota bacterium]|nr:excinuclease ABC subunit UvrC [Bacillota bacterium]
MELAEKVKQLPASSGVYIFKDAAGEIIYVGKAKNLRSRVRSYFGEAAAQQLKVEAIQRLAVDLDYILTATEVEALLLEGQLIKKHRPRYNVLLKDDKEYPYIRIDLAADYPRLEVVRKAGRDKARYFGPYPNAGVVNDTLKLANKLFPLRTCNDIRGKKRPCLNYYIRRCLAPCQGKVSPQEYRSLVDQAIMFLEGKHQELEARLHREMKAAADSFNFEKAAELRDQLAALAKLTTPQRIVTNRRWNLDVLAVAVEPQLAAAQLIKVRGGKVLGNEYHGFEQPELADSGEAVSAFIRDYYASASLLPAEILVQQLPEDAEALETWLGSRRQGKVVLKVPQRGEKRMLLDMAQANLASHMEADLRQQQESQGQGKAVLEQLASALGMGRLPIRIECYDISHFQGSQTVASMVVFEHGRPARSQYRRFRIRGIPDPDDFASMAQVIRRRFEAAREDREGFNRLPSLVVVDGGKGQLSAALAQLASLGYAGIDIVSLAKREEEIFIPGRSEPLVLDRDDPALQLLQQIRDEAHRFAISYHRRLRSKETLLSELERIPGVGPARRTALLKAFGSIQNLRDKDVAEIAAVLGMTWPAAEEVYKWFRKKK